MDIRVNDFLNGLNKLIIEAEQKNDDCREKDIREIKSYFLGALKWSGYRNFEYLNIRFVSNVIYDCFDDDQQFIITRHQNEVLRMLDNLAMKEKLKD